MLLAHTTKLHILLGLKRFSLIQLPELLNNISIKMLMAALKLELDGQNHNTDISVLSTAAGTSFSLTLWR